MRLVFNSSPSSNFRSYLITMYLFIPVFTTEKLYYFKVQFYWYLKEIFSKENGNDLKHDPIKYMYFLIIDGKCE